jgi:membrane protein
MFDTILNVSQAVVTPPPDHRRSTGLLPSGAGERGAAAGSPAEFGWRAWRDILRRVWQNSSRHNVGFLAAGVAFYGFLSLAPFLALVVMVYGSLADPATLYDRMVELIRVVPAEAAMIINQQLVNLIKTATETKGWAIVPAALLSLYGASGAAGGMISSLNVIYEQEEKRNILKLTFVSVALAVAAILLALLGILAASVLALVQFALSDMGSAGIALVRAATWIVAFALATFAVAIMYRYGPCREDAKWRWLTLGSAVGTALWLLGSVLFGWYASVANYATTYGSLGAVVALLMWIFVSAYSVLLGAFINAESERQTARDSTTGPERPMGNRGAVVADSSSAIEEDSSAKRE